MTLSDLTALANLFNVILVQLYSGWQDFD